MHSPESWNVSGQADPGWWNRNTGIFLPFTDPPLLQDGFGTAGQELKRLSWGYVQTQISNMPRAISQRVGMEEVPLCVDKVFIPSDPNPSSRAEPGAGCSGCAACGPPAATAAAEPPASPTAAPPGLMLWLIEAWTWKRRVKAPRCFHLLHQVQLPYFSEPNDCSSVRGGGKVCEGDLGKPFVRIFTTSGPRMHRGAACTPGTAWGKHTWPQVWYLLLTTES